MSEVDFDLGPCWSVKTSQTSRTTRKEKHTTDTQRLTPARVVLAVPSYAGNHPAGSPQAPSAPAAAPAAPNLPPPNHERELTTTTSTPTRGDPERCRRTKQSEPTSVPSAAPGARAPGHRICTPQGTQRQPNAQAHDDSPTPVPREAYPPPPGTRPPHPWATNV